MGRKCRGIRCRDRNLTFFATFCCCNSLFFELSQHWIPATFNVFEKKLFSLIFPKRSFVCFFVVISCKIFIQLTAFLEAFFFPCNSWRLKIPVKFRFSNFCDNFSSRYFFPIKYRHSFHLIKIRLIQRNIKKC